MSYYAGISGWRLCLVDGGCRGNGHCPECGEVNYALLGWYGARARWAKQWGITVEEVEKKWAAKADAEIEALMGEQSNGLSTR